MTCFEQSFLCVQSELASKLPSPDKDFKWQELSTCLCSVQSTSDLTIPKPTNLNSKATFLKIYTESKKCN